MSSKRKLTIIIPAIVLIILFVLMVGTLVFSKIAPKQYRLVTRTLEMYINWNKAPSMKGCEIEFYDDNSGWMGDGDRYHILQYDSEESLTKGFEWCDLQTLDERNAVNGYVARTIQDICESSLEHLSIENDLRPDFDNVLGFYFKKDLDCLILLIDKDLLRMYVFQVFI